MVRRDWSSRRCYGGSPSPPLEEGEEEEDGHVVFDKVRLGIRDEAYSEKMTMNRSRCGASIFHLSGG